MFVCGLYIVSCIRLIDFAVSSTQLSLLLTVSLSSAMPPPRAVPVFIGPNEKKEMLAYSLPAYPSCCKVSSTTSVFLDEWPV